MGGYCTFSTGGDPLGGLSRHEPASPGGWSTCFAVSSTDAAVAAAESAGGKTLMPAQDSPYGRFAVLEDPWGAAFSVMEATGADRQRTARQIGQPGARSGARAAS